MSVKVNGIDIKDMIQGGTYATIKTIPGLIGLPTGEKSPTEIASVLAANLNAAILEFNAAPNKVYEWDSYGHAKNGGIRLATNKKIAAERATLSSLAISPNPFGIRINGNDICSLYHASYTDTPIPIPNGVKALKVFCIGGGKGGQGSSGTYKVEGVTKYWDVLGKKGGDGEYREIDIPVINTVNTFSMVVGTGSVGTVRGKDTKSKWDSPVVMGAETLNGLDTTFTYNGITYTSKDGTSDSNYTNRSLFGKGGYG